jgi:hypothetical protein
LIERHNYIRSTAARKEPLAGDEVPFLDCVFEVIVPTDFGVLATLLADFAFEGFLVVEVAGRGALPQPRLPTFWNDFVDL